MSQPNTERRLWTPDENEIILNAVEQSPNASRGFNLAVTRLHERTYSAVSGHYYDLLNKQNGTPKKKKKKSPVIQRFQGGQPPLEIGQTLMQHPANNPSGHITVYRPQAKKNNVPMPDDTELYETICMLIPRLNPGRRLDLVKFLFADH